MNNFRLGDYLQLINHKVLKVRHNRYYKATIYLDLHLELVEGGGLYIKFYDSVMTSTF